MTSPTNNQASASQDPRWEQARAERKAGAEVPRYFPLKTQSSL
jgi:hypothetical protein